MGEGQSNICGFNKKKDGGEPELCEELLFDSSGRCIFHTPHGKPGFWEAFNDYEAKFLSTQPDDEGTDSSLLDCRGFKFPNETINIEGRIFKAPIDLSHAVFPEDITFKTVTFESVVLFDSAVFEGNCHFLNSIFDGETVFSNCRFKGIAAFLSVLFDRKVHFSRAEFSGYTVFREVKFLHNVYFTNTFFNGETTFVLILIKEKGDFSGSTFEKRTLFERVLKDIEMEGYATSFFNVKKLKVAVVDDIPEVEFKKVQLGAASKIEFNNTNLSRFSFANTYGLEDPSRTSFVDVNWRPRGRRKRKVVGDEKTLREREWQKKILRSFILNLIRPYSNLIKYYEGLPKEEKKYLFNVFVGVGIKQLPPKRKDVWRKLVNYYREEIVRDIISAAEALGEVYRRLRINFEMRLAYEAASDFHIGQMETLLKNPATSKFKKLFLWWYKWISNFGESVSRPLWWFTGLWLLFAVFWFFEGFEYNGRTVNYDFIWPSVVSPTLETVKDIGKSLLFSFKTFLTLPYLQERVASQALGAVQRLAGVSVIALFILALRRAFRR